MALLRSAFGALAGASILLFPALSSAQEPPRAPSPPPGVTPAPGTPPYAAPYGMSPQYPAMQPFTETRMVTHSPALMGGGIALVSIGVLSAFGAATAFAEDSGHGGSGGLLSLIVGLPLLAHGLGCIGGGIPMIVIGARKLPVEVPRAMPMVVGTRGGAGVGWRF